MSEPRQCFRNSYAQAVHRYADGVLLLFIAALAWWLVALDGRVTKEGEARQVIVQEQGRSKAQNEEVLRRLDVVNAQLTVIDQRIYALVGSRLKSDNIP